MPTAPTYPGVYIEEIPSGVRTIVGVATSVTAFIGRTKLGPTDDPVLISGYADFERRFGGLWEESALSYAVRDYFLNGGSQALIVRVFKAGSADDGLARISFSDTLKLVAASPGSWGAKLSAVIDAPLASPTEDDV